MLIVNIKIILFMLLCSFVNASTIQLDQNAKFYDLLPISEIYIDKTKSLTIDDIQKEDIEFKKNNDKLLGYGYSPNFDVWIKFTLQNNTSEHVSKIIEYDNSLTTEILFFDTEKDTVVKEGLFHENKDRYTVNPIYKIDLKPNETKTYYIKASSYVMTLIIKLNLWDDDSFNEKEIKHQFILALFFGSMFILAVYNLFIYFFTKDRSYLYYVLYIIGIIIHHLIYVGIANTYILNQDGMMYVIKFASLFIAFPVFALALFSQVFLQTKQYPKFNKILNIFLVVFVVFVIVVSSTDLLNKYRNILSISLLVFLIILTIYSALKKNRQAYFILIGWFMIFLAGIFMYLSSTGIFNIYQYFPYLIETSFVLEATIFSIALADRIRELQKKLSLQQENEKKRLKIQVDKKTLELKLLLKELNHRVKNNMQMIVSLIRLQSDGVDNEKLKNILIVIENRINAMGHLHELLYKKDDLNRINAYEYFDRIIDEVSNSYYSDIKIHFNIKVELEVEQAIYCGLIVNEVITNSFKYAFPDNEGEINIDFQNKDDIFILKISDDGIGYEQDITSKSLGSLLINTLVEEQLDGKIEIDSSNGVTVTITWRDNEN